MAFLFFGRKKTDKKKDDDVVASLFDAADETEDPDEEEPTPEPKSIPFSVESDKTIHRTVDAESDKSGSDKEEPLLIPWSALQKKQENSDLPDESGEDTTPETMALIAEEAEEALMRVEDETARTETIDTEKLIESYLDDEDIEKAEQRRIRETEKLREKAMSAERKRRKKAEKEAKATEKSDSEETQPGGKSPLFGTSSAPDMGASDASILDSVRKAAEEAGTAVFDDDWIEPEKPEKAASGNTRNEKQKKDKSKNSGIKDKPSVKKRRLQLILTLTIILALLVAAALSLCRMKSVSFENLSYYKPEDIVATLGIRKNDSLLLFSEAKAKKKIAKNYPYIESISVRRNFPDNLVIRVTQDAPLFYTEIFGDWFVISANLRVLERYDSEDKVDKGLIKLHMSDASYAVVGEELQFIDETYLSFLKDIVPKLRASSAYEKISEMDLTYRFRISFRYEDRLTVNFGSVSDFDTKMLFLDAIIAKLKPDDIGTVNLVSIQTAAVTLNAG